MSAEDFKPPQASEAKPPISGGGDGGDGAIASSKPAQSQSSTVNSVGVFLCLIAHQLENRCPYFLYVLCKKTLKL